MATAAAFIASSLCILKDDSLQSPYALHNPNCYRRLSTLDISVGNRNKLPKLPSANPIKTLFHSIKALNFWRKKGL